MASLIKNIPTNKSKAAATVKKIEKNKEKVKNSVKTRKSHIKKIGGNLDDEDDEGNEEDEAQCGEFNKGNTKAAIQELETKITELNTNILAAGIYNNDGNSLLARTLNTIKVRNINNIAEYIALLQNIINKASDSNVKTALLQLINENTNKDIPTLNREITSILNIPKNKELRDLLKEIIETFGDTNSGYIYIV